MNTILLVEDDPACATMLRTALTTFGHQVVLAPDGKQALQLFDPQAMNVAVVDLMMPEMDGMQLILKLQERDPAVRVIAMTGGGRGRPEAYLRMAERLGAVKSLAKPFPLEDLQRAVAECLDS